MTAIFVAEILRYFIGFVLLAAVVGKLRTFAVFRDNLVSSFGMPPAASALAAPALVAAELLVAAMVMGQLGRPGMLAALLLFGAFTAIVTYRFLQEGVVRCSCFGEAERNISALDLVRNGLVVSSIVAYLALAAVGQPSWHVSLLAAGLASVLAVLAVHFHDVVTLLRTS